MSKSWKKTKTSTEYSDPKYKDLTIKSKPKIIKLTKSTRNNHKLKANNKISYINFYSRLLIWIIRIKNFSNNVMPKMIIWKKLQIRFRTSRKI